MTGSQYRCCMEWTRCHIGVKKVRWMVKLFTAFSVAGYGAVLLLLWLRASGRAISFADGMRLGSPGDYFLLWRMVLVPAVSFLALTLFRSALSAPRPYEVYGFVPLLEKDTKGKSFPSRHVFSNFIIAMAVLSVSVPGGLFLLACGVCLAILRVITGVHFPKDVVAGAVLAVAAGCFGFFFL